MNYHQAKKEAEKFLSDFTRSDFADMKLYAKMKMYRSHHKKGILTKGSYEAILKHLGYTKEETFSKPQPPSDKLIDILF